MQLPLHYDGLQERVLGALQPRLLCSLPPLSAAFEEMPESSWVECSAKHWDVPVWDQGALSSCVGMATGAAFTYAWLLSGQPRQEFSPTSVYAYINGNVDQGARVADAVTVLKSRGISLMSLFGVNKIYTQQMTQDVVKTATRFRAVEVYKINNWRQMGTALVRGMIVVSGIAVGRNFSQLGSGGIAPLPDSVIGGHALAHIGLKRIGGQWVVETHNSWSRDWGNGGFCYLQQNAWHPNYGYPFDAFAIGGVYDDPLDDTTDPIILT